MTDDGTAHVTEPEMPLELEPMLAVVWRGHRVEIHADPSLRGHLRGALREDRLDAPFLIVSAVQRAPELTDIAPALRATALGETHDVDVRVEDGRITVSLRPLSDLV